MKRVGVTQRVVEVEHYKERRDCIDQRWASLLLECGFLPITLPNMPPNYAKSLISEYRLDAIILSGGNTLARQATKDDVPALERDSFEKALIDGALELDCPVLGVCRGMQVIHNYYGGSFVQVKDHVNIKHKLSIFDKDYPLRENVNSFHNWGIALDQLPKILKPLAVHQADQTVEAFRHTDKKLFGIMWHPEREGPFAVKDIELIKRLIA
jgi:gamma-glutamyl-gamma-aminobutyrate hydrolase PuuD